MSKKKNPNPSEVNDVDATETSMDPSTATTESSAVAENTSDAGSAQTDHGATDVLNGSESLGTPGNHPTDTKPDLAPPAAAPQATGDDFVRRDPEEVVGKVVVLTNGIIVDRVQKNEGGGFRYVGYYVGNVDTTKAMLGKAGEVKYFNADQIAEIATAT